MLQDNIPSSGKHIKIIIIYNQHIVYVHVSIVIAFLSNQSFVNVVCRLLNAAKVETNTSFNNHSTDPV